MAKQSSSNAGRAAELLILLSEAGPKGMSLGAMAESCGEARSSVHRTLTALGDYGFVVQGGNRGNYRLGPAAFALAQRTPSINEITAIYRPALLEITEKTQLSSYLMMRSGLMTICVDQHVGEIYAQPYVSGLGGRIPLGVGVSGVVILGQMEARSRDRAFELLEPQWAQWDLSPETIRREIDEFQLRGHMRGIRRSHGIESLTLSIPVLSDGWSGLEAAISVLAPLNVLNEAQQDETIAVMRAALKRAEDISVKLRKI